MARKLITDADLGIKLAWSPPGSKGNRVGLRKKLHEPQDSTMRAERRFGTVGSLRVA